MCLCVCVLRSLKELLVQKCEVKLLETGEVVPLSSNSGRCSTVANVSSSVSLEDYSLVCVLLSM